MQEVINDPTFYPESDGKPMADNTLQWEWNVTIKTGLDEWYSDQPMVFVAGDLLWYPVQGHPEIVAAPDAMVVFGRPKGYRGSYRQWREGNIAPQVVFEVLSPSNTQAEMSAKRQWYERYGVEEYYQYDPNTGVFLGWYRQEGQLQPIADIEGWISPRMNIRFEVEHGQLVMYRPDGERILSDPEVRRQAREVRLQLAAQRQVTQAEREAKEAAQQSAQVEREAKDSALQRIKELEALLNQLASQRGQPDNS